MNSDVTKLSLVICLRNEALSAVMLRATHTLNPRISIIFTPPLNFGGAVIRGVEKSSFRSFVWRHVTLIRDGRNREERNGGWGGRGKGHVTHVGTRGDIKLRSWENMRSPPFPSLPGASDLEPWKLPQKTFLFLMAAGGRRQRPPRNLQSFFPPNNSVGLFFSPFVSCFPNILF